MDTPLLSGLDFDQETARTLEARLSQLERRIRAVRHAAI